MGRPGTAHRLRVGRRFEVANLGPVDGVVGLDYEAAEVAVRGVGRDLDGDVLAGFVAQAGLIDEELRG